MVQDVGNNVTGFWESTGCEIFLCGTGVGFELRVLPLLDRCSTT
jgi:hypothetical protein